MGKSLSVIALVVALAVGGGLSGLLFTGGLQGPAGINGKDGNDGEDGVDGINGEEGEDAPGYACSTRAEVQAAINAIGNGAGTITITADFAVTTTIQVDQGGNYIIRGDGAHTITSSLTYCIRILNVNSCIIQDLTFVVSGQAIYIQEANDNPVTLRDLIVVGTGASDYGVYGWSDNIRVESCTFSNESYGVRLRSSSHCQVENCIFTGGNIGVDLYFMNCSIVRGNSFGNIGSNGIHSYSSNHTVYDANTNSNTGFAIYLEYDTFATVSGNTLYSIERGIYLYYTDYASISGNTIEGEISTTDDAFGIYLTNADLCSITGNGIYNLHPAGYIGRAVHITSGNYNNIVGNIFGNNQDGNYDGGTGNVFANNLEYT